MSLSIENINSILDTIISNSTELHVLKKKIIYYIIVIFLFTNIVESIKDDDHFVGLNKNTTFMDTVYYISISFSGWNYSNIYPQTSLGKTIILVLSLIKLYVIVGHPITNYEFYNNQNKLYNMLLDTTNKDAAPIMSNVITAFQKIGNSKQ